MHETYIGKLNYTDWLTLILRLYTNRYHEIGSDNVKVFTSCNILTQHLLKFQAIFYKVALDLPNVTTLNFKFV